MVKRDTKEKRLIDIARDSAISMTIGPDTSSKNMIPITVGKSLYCVRDKDIYTMILADETDPDRTNIKVPNAQQKVCDYGLSDPLIGATLLTADRFFKVFDSCQDVDRSTTMQLAFNCTNELIGLRNIAQRLQRAITDGLESFQQSDQNILPHTENLVSDLKTYFEKTKQLFIQWTDLTKLLFPEVRNGQLTGLLQHLEAVYPADHHFKDYVKEVLKHFEYLSAGRNAVIHPEQGVKELQVFDYTLKPDHTLLSPTFAVVYPKITYEIWAASSFTLEMTTMLTDYTEHMFAFFGCYTAHVKDSGGFQKTIGILPPEQQRNFVRLSYFVNLNGSLQPLG